MRRGTRAFVFLIPVVGALVAMMTFAGPAVGTSSTRAVPRPTRVVKGAGDIATKVARYRVLLGADNGGEPVSHPSGYREISWDSVPEQFARPNLLPPDFFNAPTAPRARGAVLRTPGTGVAVSAPPTNGSATALRFGDLNPTYPDRFRTFSAEQLFSPIGSNVVNLTFFVPGTTQRAAVRGFGAVYTDIDRAENTAFEYFDARGRSLGKFAVPPLARGLSFLGVVFRNAVVAKVRIKYGNHALGPNDSKRYDVAVMDNFIYGEPQPISP